MSKNKDGLAKLKVTLVCTEVSHGQQSRSNTETPLYILYLFNNMLFSLFPPESIGLPNTYISNIHNHNILVADAVRQWDVGSESVEKLTKLFKAGHSSSSALDVLKYDLQVQCEDDYIYTSADSSICPDLQFCYRCL